MHCIRTGQNSRCFYRINEHMRFPQVVSREDREQWVPGVEVMTAGNDDISVLRQTFQSGYLSRIRQAEVVSTASEEDVRLVQIIRIRTNTYTAAPYAEVSERRSVVVNDVGC